MLDLFSRCKLHTSFCMSLYGSELWNYNSRYIEDAWRKTMRKLFRFPYRTHKINYVVCGIAEDISIKLHRRVTKYSMIHGDNDTVKLMTAFFLSTEASFLAGNIILYTYNIPMFTWYKELSMLLKCITCPSSP